jgi:hypothetical protein
MSMHGFHTENNHKVYIQQNLQNTHSTNRIYLVVIAFCDCSLCIKSQNKYHKKFYEKQNPYYKP